MTIYGIIKPLNSSLADRTSFPNSEVFYPDYQDGKYGFNTDPNRGADTFCPFKSFANCTITLTMPWNSSFTKSGTMNVTIEIVNGKISSVTSPGRIQIASDGNWIDLSHNSASLTEN